MSTRAEYFSILFTPQGWIGTWARSRTCSASRMLHGRHYLFPMLDAWTNVFQVPGKRTTGTGPQTYADHRSRMVGHASRLCRRDRVQSRRPTWSGFLGGILLHRYPDRTYSGACVAGQNQAEVPLSSYGMPYTPAAGTVDPEHRQ